MNLHTKKMIAPIVITVLVVVYYLLYFGIIAALLGGIWKVVFGIVPLIFSIVMIGVCVQRIKEIQGGEDDDLSKY